MVMNKVTFILFVAFHLQMLCSSSYSSGIGSFICSSNNYWTPIILFILSNGILAGAGDQERSKTTSTRTTPRMNPQPSTSRIGCDHVSFPSDNVYSPKCTQCHSFFTGPAPMGALECNLPAIMHSIMLSHIYATQINAIMYHYLNSRPQNYVGTTIPKTRFKNTALSMERYNRYYSSKKCFVRGARPTTKYDQDRSNPYTDPRRPSCMEPDVYARLRRYLDCSPLIHSNGVTSSSQLTIENVARHNANQPLNNNPEPFIKSLIDDNIVDVHVARAYSVDQYQVTTQATSTTVAPAEELNEFAFLQDDTGSICTLSPDEVGYLENIAPFNMGTNVNVVNSMHAEQIHESGDVIDFDNGNLRSNINVLRTHYVDSINILNVEPVDLYNNTELVDVQYGDSEFYQHRRKRSSSMYYCQCNDYSYADASLILLNSHLSVKSNDEIPVKRKTLQLPSRMSELSSQRKDELYVSYDDYDIRKRT